MTLSDRDRLNNLERYVEHIQDEIARLPIEIPEIGEDFDAVLIGQVNQPLGVPAGQAQFPVDGLLTYNPPAAATSEITVENPLSMSWTFADNEPVLVFRHSKNDKYYVVKIGGGSSSVTNIVCGRLTQDLPRATTSATAILLDDDGNATSTVVHAVDKSARWYGLGPYASPYNSSEPGYRFWGLQFTSDYNSTGQPGIHIMAMEGPATSVMVVLKNISGSSGLSGIGPFDAELQKASIDALGSNLAARAPKQEGASDIHVYNYHRVADGAESEEIFIVSWEPFNERYELSHNPRELIIVRGTAQSDVTRATSFFDIANLRAIQGRIPLSLGNPVASITVKNDPDLVVDQDENVYAKYDIIAGNDETDRWTTACTENFELIMKGHEDFDATKLMVFGSDTGDLKWLETIELSFDLP